MTGSTTLKPTRVLSFLLATMMIAAAGGQLRAGSRKADLTSTWRAGDTIAIDGVNQEWQGKLTPIKDTPVSMAFYNDGEFLYLCLTTSDQATRTAIKRQGLTVWFDSEGGKKKDFGVEYPLGLPGMTVVERSGEMGEPSIRDRPLDADTERLAILGPGKSDRETMGVEEAPGIQAKLGDENGVLVYEMKVPLRKADGVRYAIGATPDAIIGIGLETPEFQHPQSRTGMSGGDGGEGGRGGRGGWGGMGGMPGGMGGRGGYGRPGGEGGRGQMPKPLKQWATVLLAAPAH
ncbi:MAG: hypothetical protein ACM3NQ_11845 [Bacteroidales bacterium]